MFHDMLDTSQFSKIWRKVTCVYVTDSVYVTVVAYLKAFWTRSRGTGLSIAI